MQRDGVIDKYAIGGAVERTFYLEPAATPRRRYFCNTATAATSSLLPLTPIYQYLTARGSKVDGPHIVIGSWPVQFLPLVTTWRAKLWRRQFSAEVDGVRTWIMTAEHLAAIALHTGVPRTMHDPAIPGAGRAGIALNPRQSSTSPSNPEVGGFPNGKYLEKYDEQTLEKRDARSVSPRSVFPRN